MQGRTQVEIKQGTQFGKLVIIDRAESKNGNRRYNCICDCGNKTIKIATSLLKGETTNCGCYNVILAKQRSTTHGKSNTLEFNVWVKVRNRCYNIQDKAYKDYGGRGIVMSKDWRLSFERFILDMGRRPSNKHTLERINNELGYCKSNCKWATRTEQNRNKRTNVIIMYRGVRFLLVDFANKLKVGHSAVSYHLKNGRTPEWIVKCIGSKKNIYF